VSTTTHHVMPKKIEDVDMQTLTIKEDALFHVPNLPIVNTPHSDPILPFEIP
jgi:hypothetical protein